MTISPVKKSLTAETAESAETPLRILGELCLLRGSKTSSLPNTLQRPRAVSGRRSARGRGHRARDRTARGAGRPVADLLRLVQARTGFSPLRQIAVDNVARLRPVWVYQPPGTGSIECTPIVADGVMYVTSGPTSVVALDLRSGKPIWEWTRPIAAEAC